MTHFRKRIGILLLFLSLSCLTACGGADIPAGEDTAPLLPFDYLGADLSDYPALSPALYTDMTLTLSREEVYLYHVMDSDGEDAGDETEDMEALRFALEDAILLRLITAYGDGIVPEEDYAYNLAALENYFESIRVYENTLLSLYGTPEDMTPDLGSYVAKTFSLPDAAAGEQYLRENALAISRGNLVVALVFHAANLTVSEETLRCLAEELTKEAAANALTVEGVASQAEALTPDHPLVRNQALYEAVMTYLLREGNYTILWEP